MDHCMDTLARRSIQHCLSMLSPLCAQTPGQEAFYRFMVSLYQGMLENPEKYFVFSAPYDTYIQKKGPLTKPGKKEKAHIPDSWESTLRNGVQHAISFYAAFLYDLGCAGEMEKNGLLVSSFGWEAAKQRAERLRDRDHNAGRLEMLKASGLKIEETDKGVLLSSLAYPGMEEGLYALCHVPDHPFRYMNFLRLDYKNADRGAPGVEDICKTLCESSVQAIEALEKRLSGLNPKKVIRPLRGIVSDFGWKVEYRCGGKNICGFYAHPDSLKICVYFNDYKNINAFAAQLQVEDPKLFSWFRDQFPERLCACPHNRRVMLGDESRRICGLSNRAETDAPTLKDIDNVLRILTKFRNLPEQNE